MNINDVETVLITYFKSNPGVGMFLLGSTLVKLWEENPGMEEAMDKYAEEHGEEKANEWLANILSKTGKYNDEKDGYVSPKPEKHKAKRKE